MIALISLGSSDNFTTLRFLPYGVVVFQMTILFPQSVSSIFALGFKVSYNLDLLVASMSVNDATALSPFLLLANNLLT